MSQVGCLFTTWPSSVRACRRFALFRPSPSLKNKIINLYTLDIKIIKIFLTIKYINKTVDYIMNNIFTYQKGICHAVLLQPL